ncbi:hypothetical protein ACSSS7_002782 [Eimeria intestinalis]
MAPSRSWDVLHSSEPRSRVLAPTAYVGPDRARRRQRRRPPAPARRAPGGRPHAPLRPRTSLHGHCRYPLILRRPDLLAWGLGGARPPGVCPREKGSHAPLPRRCQRRPSPESPRRLTDVTRARGPGPAARACPSRAALVQRPGRVPLALALGAAPRLARFRPALHVAPTAAPRRPWHGPGSRRLLRVLLPPTSRPGAGCAFGTRPGPAARALQTRAARGPGDGAPAPACRHHWRRHGSRCLLRVLLPVASRPGAGCAFGTRSGPAASALHAERREERRARAGPVI